MTNPLTPSRAQFLDDIARSAPPGDFVECGVYIGWSAEILIKASEGKRRIYLCDSFAGFPDASGEPNNVRKCVRLSQADKMTEAVVRKYLTEAGAPLDNVVFIAGFFKDSLPALAETKPRIALLHFDGDLYTSAVDVFKNLLPLVVPGGYVVIHDYPAFEGVARAVREFFDVTKLVVQGPEEVYLKKV